MSHVKWNGTSHFIATVSPEGDLDRTDANFKSAQVKFERVLLTHLKAQQAQIAHELHDLISQVTLRLFSAAVPVLASTAESQQAVDTERCRPGTHRRSSLLSPTPATAATRTAGSPHAGSNRPRSAYRCAA